MPKNLTEKNIGKWFEDKVQDTLETMRNQKQCTYLRLYDSHSARGKFLPPQPGDFVIAINGSAYMTECKSSVKHSSLRSCVGSHVKPEQTALMRLWLSSDNPAFFLFYSAVTEQLEIWDGKSVVTSKVSGTPLDFKDRLAIGNLSEFPSLLKNLTRGGSLTAYKTYGEFYD